MESVHIQRQRAQAAQDLIDHYIQFSRGDTDRLDVLRKQSGKEGRRELAVILRRLNTVAKEVDLPTAEQVNHLSMVVFVTVYIRSWTTDARKHRQILREVRERHVELV